MTHAWRMILVAILAGGMPAVGNDIPGDRSKEAYEKLRQQLQEKYTRLAAGKSEFTKEDKQLERLDNPVEMNEKVTITWYSRGKPTVHEGRLYKVLRTKALVGGRWVIKRDVDPIDWQRLVLADKPKELKKIVEERRELLKNKRKKWIKTNVMGELERAGYDKKFWAHTLEVDGNFYLRRELGDKTVEVSVKIPRDLEYVEEFITLTMSYRDGLRCAAMLEVNMVPRDLPKLERPADGEGEGTAAEDPDDAKAGKKAKRVWTPIAAVFGVGGKHGIQGRVWRSREFRYLLTDLADSPQELFDLLSKRSRIVFLSANVGRWYLRPEAATRGRPERERTHTCLECWGARYTKPDPKFEVELEKDKKADTKQPADGDAVDVGKEKEPADAADKTGAETPAKDETDGKKKEDDFSDIVDGGDFADDDDAGDKTAADDDRKKNGDDDVDAAMAKARADGKVECRACNGRGIVTGKHRSYGFRIRYELDEDSLGAYDRDRVRAFELATRKLIYDARVKKRQEIIGALMRENRIALLKGAADQELALLRKKRQRELSEKLEETIDNRFAWYTHEQAEANRARANVTIDIKDWIPAEGVEIDDAVFPHKVLGMKIRRFNAWTLVPVGKRNLGVYEIITVHFRILEVESDDEKAQPTFILQYAMKFLGGANSLVLKPELKLPVEPDKDYGLPAAEKLITIKQTFSPRARWLGTLLGAKIISTEQMLGTIKTGKDDAVLNVEATKK